MHRTNPRYRLHVSHERDAFALFNKDKKGSEEAVAVLSNVTHVSISTSSGSVITAGAIPALPDSVRLKITNKRQIVMRDATLTLIAHPPSSKGHVSHVLRFLRLMTVRSPHIKLVQHLLGILS